MDTPSIPELSPEERAAQRKEAKRLYNKAWQAAHRGYASRKSKAWRAQHPEESKSYDLHYKATHVAEMAAQRKQYNEAHAAERAAAHKAWRKRNQAHLRERDRAWRAAHPEKKREADRRYRAKQDRAVVTARQKANRHKRPEHYAQKSLERNRKWRQDYPERSRAHVQKRLAQKANAPINDFTAKEWRALCKASGYRCAYCDQKFSFKQLTMDHITPLSKGGSHTLSNILPACLSCNSRKNAHDVLKPVQPFLLLSDEEAAD